jgi:hypothetical protein
MKKTKLIGAEKLRDHMLAMVIGHFCFLFLEFMLYNRLITFILCEFFYLWVLFQAYMTLNQYITGLYIALMFLAPVQGIFRFIDVGLGLSTVIYLAQLAIYGYAGGYITFLKLKNYRVDFEKKK